MTRAEMDALTTSELVMALRTLKRGAAYDAIEDEILKRLEGARDEIESLCAEMIKEARDLNRRKGERR